MKKVILHIGTQKTGTGSIRNFFLTNRVALMNTHDIDFLEFDINQNKEVGEVISGHHSVAYWLKICDQQKINFLVSEIKNSPCGTVVLSCHKFYHLLFEEQISFLAKQLHPFTVEVLCYVRRQDEYIESVWKQQVKIGELKTPFTEFLRRHTDPTAIKDEHANYYRMLSPWVKFFGTQAVHVRVFDSSVFYDSDLLHDVLKSCGVTTPVDFNSLIRPRISAMSMPSELIELIRISNAMKLVEESEKESFFQFLGNAGNFYNPPLMSRADRLSVMKNYQASNELLFSDLMHQKMPTCFTAQAIAGAEFSKVSDDTPSVLLPPGRIALRALRALWKAELNIAPASADSSLPLQAPMVEYPQANSVTKESQYSNLLNKEHGLLNLTTGTNQENRTANLAATLQKFGLLAPETEINFLRHLVLQRSAPRGGYQISRCGTFDLHGFNTPFAIKIKPLQDIPLKFMEISAAVLTASRLDSENQGIYGGIYDGTYRLIAGATYRGDAVYRTADPPTLPAVRAESARHIDGSCVYLGWWPDHFGHFLIEATARLWAARETLAFCPTFVMHPLNPNVSLSAFARKKHVQLIFEAFGISEENLILAQSDLRCDQLFVPTSQMALSLYIGKHQSKIFDQIIHHVCRSDKPSYKNRRIYLSREALSDTTRKAINEAEISAYFASIGFDIIHPERIPFDDQIRLMQSASVIAGCDGSALHMGVFMPKGGMVICLSAREISRNQLLVGSIRQLRTHIINAKEGDKPLPDWRSPWRADLSVIKRHVDRLL